MADRYSHGMSYKDIAKDFVLTAKFVEEEIRKYLRKNIEFIKRHKEQAPWPQPLKVCR